MRLMETKKGRTPQFKCIYCGQFLPYDYRKIKVENRTERKFNVYEEQWFPEEVVEMYHKHCKTLAKRQALLSK
jgi:hypothetical protein